MKDLISIIVPIYNVEMYLEECIESLLNQTYKNIEVILVDDGSPDNSASICKKYKKIDSRVIFIHKENGGLSDARNAGLKVAKGDYICFVDSDDLVLNNYIELLYSAIKDNNTMISQCGFSYFSNGKIENKVGYTESSIISRYNYFIDNFSNHRLDNTVVWNKMFSKDLLNSETFEKGKIHEDEFFTYKIIDKVDNISIISDCLYLYRINDTSITKKKYNINRLSALEAFKIKNDYFKNKYDNLLYTKFANVYLDLLLEHYYLVSLNIKDKKIENNIANDFHKIYKKFKIYDKKLKLKAMIFNISPRLFYFIMKIK